MGRMAQGDSGVRPTGGQRFVGFFCWAPSPFYSNIRTTGKGCAW